MKRLTKILSCFLFACVCTVCCLAGCATVSNIQNNDSDLIYNGNSAVIVNDNNENSYLYYGNGYADFSSFTKNKDYTNAAKTSYLARLQITKGGMDSIETKGQDYSAKNISNVSKEVVSHDNSFMFVLGQYIYFASPNTQEMKDSEGNISQKYNYISIFRSKLNGDGKKKIYTSTNEVSSIEVLKTDGKYYIVLLAGEDLIKIDLSNNKNKVIASGVTSLAMPETYQKQNSNTTSLDFDGYLYYTTAREDVGSSGASGNSVWAVNLSTDEKVSISNSVDTKIEFIGRQKDVVFFTLSRGNNATEIYMLDVAAHCGETALENKKFISTASGYSQISLVAIDGLEYGWVYMNGSVMNYLTKDGANRGEIKFTVDGGDLSTYSFMFVSDRTVYLYNENKIYRADISNVFAGRNTAIACETVVSMTSIKSEKLFAFDGTYLYFYAGLETVEDNDDADEKQEDEGTDGNSYLYRAKVSGTNKYQLLGKSTLKSRQS